MKKALITILQYVIFLGLGIWIIYHLIHQLKPGEPEEMVRDIRSVHLWLLVPIFIVGFLSHFFRALRWRLLLETVQIHPSIVNTTFSVLIGYITNLALPRAGEVAKCTVLARYENMPAHKMVGTIVAERAFDLICLFLIAIVAFALQSSVIGKYASTMFHDVFGQIFRDRIGILITLGIIIIIIIAIRMVYKRHKETKVGHFMREMSHGVFSILRMKKHWEFFGYTFLIWLMYITQIYLGFLCLPATAHLSLLAALVVLIFGSLGMITTPGGIGAYPLLVGQILVFYAINKVSAQAFGWVAWAVQTGTIIIFGIISLVLLPIYNRRGHVQASVDTKQSL